MSFDASALLNSNAAGPMATEMTKCPEGEYIFMVIDEDLTNSIRQFTSKKNNETYTAMRLPCLCQDENVKAELKREKVIVPYEMFLEFDTNGALSVDGDDNVALGQLRRALGMNSGTFSLNMLRGAGPFRGVVVWQADRDNPEVTRAKITRVSAV